MNPKTDIVTSPVLPGVFAMPRLFRYVIGTLILLSGGAVMLTKILSSVG